MNALGLQDKHMRSLQPPHGTKTDVMHIRWFEFYAKCFIL